jgi:outer membrane receptor protein involved in Fe transport
MAGGTMTRYRRLWPIWAGACLLVSLAPGRAHAQATTGWIAGTVHDATGAVVPGVTVTVTGPALQRENLTAVTAADGTYRVPLVPPGVYTVSAELSGFGTNTHTDVEVLLNRQTTLDFSLKVAAVSESVQVSGASPLVEVSRADLNANVSQRTIDALPLNGRNFIDLIGLAPGARPDPTRPEGTNVQIFGERGAAVSYLVDGTTNNDPLNGGPRVRYTQDSIKEFEVITSGYDAEFGQAQGGVANIITRSGTNGFDARAFWFYRNNKLDSSNVSGQSPPELNRNQWGATLGGPIKRDSMFFFGSFERLDETRGTNFDLSTIPQFVRDGLATPGGVEDFSIGPKTGGYTAFGKFDWTVTGNHRLSVSLDRSTQDVTGSISSPVAGTVALPSAAATTATPALSVNARDTAVFGPSTFLESSGIYVRGENGNNLDRTTRAEPLLILLRSGFLQTGAPFGGRVDRTSDQYAFQQALSHFVTGMGGDHSFKVGWGFDHARVTGTSEVTNDVEYSAAFLFPNVNDIMTDLFTNLGFEQSAARFFTLSANPNGSLDVDMTNNQLGLFAQDTWQPRHDLTISLGLRYDWSSLFGGDKNNLAPRLGISWDVGARHTTVVKANWGIFFDRNVLSAAATVPEKGGVFTRSAFDVALPRLGADYTDSLIDLVITSGFPTGPGTRGPAENPLYTPMANALRANHLAIYQLLGIDVPDPSKPPVVTADTIRQLSGLSPAEAVARLESTWPGTDWEFFDVPGGSIVGDRVLSFFPRGPLDQSRDVSQYAEDRTPWTRAFSVGVDQELTPNMTASVMYVHRRSRDLLTRRIVNLYDVPPGDPNFGKTTDGGPRISQVGYDGLINYDGVIVSLRKRFSQRYQVTLSYTGSKARDNLLTGDVGSTFSNNNHPELDYGVSNQSVPNIFVANGLVILPLDFHVSGIVYWRSGSAFSPRGIQDLDGDGLVDQRDTTQPRNGFRTKAYGDVDLRVEKQVPIQGGHRVTLLVEAFNLFNRDNVATVTNVSGPDFGTPATYLSGREIQIGIRYLFGAQ